MPAIALDTAKHIRIVESLEQRTMPPEVGTVVAHGNVVAVGPNGGWILATTGGAAYGVAVGSSGAGPGITAIRTGIVDGLDLTALAYDAAVGHVSGILDTAAAAGDAIGKVSPAHAQTAGSPASKVLYVDCGGK